MAYLARRDILYPSAIFHLTWQCHNEEWLLLDDSIKQLYYDLLLKYKDRYHVEFFSYCFMDNHPHLTGITHTADGLSSLLQTVHSQLSKRINKKYHRKGQAIMDRFKSLLIQTDQELLKVMRYNDLNPTRSRKRTHPRDYRWTSYHFYAYGKKDPLLTPSPAYLTLGETDQQRQEAYREMIRVIIEEEGLTKRRYSKTLYIGDPTWVKARYEEIREIQREKRAASLLRQRKILHGISPP